MLDMRDDKGRDQKLIAVPTVDPRFDEVVDLCDVSRHAIAEIEHFFQVYKELENKETEIFVQHARTAARVLDEARERAATSGGGKG